MSGGVGHENESVDYDDSFSDSVNQVSRTDA